MNFFLFTILVVVSVIANAQDVKSEVIHSIHVDSLELAPVDSVKSVSIFKRIYGLIL